VSGAVATFSTQTDVACSVIRRTAEELQVPVPAEAREIPRVSDNDYALDTC
jgi:hypothetical protein